MAAQVGLCLAWSETPKDTFCCVEANLIWGGGGGGGGRRMKDLVLAT